MVEIELHLKYLNFMVDDYFLLSIYYLCIDYLFILFFFFFYIIDTFLKVIHW